MPRYVQLTYTAPTTYKAVVILPSDTDPENLDQDTLAALWARKSFDRTSVEDISDGKQFTVVDISEDYGTADVFPSRPEPASRPRGGRRR